MTIQSIKVPISFSSALQLTIEKPQFTPEQSELTGTEFQHLPPALQHLATAFNRGRRDDLHKPYAAEMSQKNKDAAFLSKVLVIQDRSLGN